jgi:hypothetical protein
LENLSQIPAVDVDKSSEAKTLGIVSLATSLLGVHLVSFILGIIALNKSKKYNQSNGFAIAGIVISSVGMALSTLFFIGIIMGSLTQLQATQKEYKDNLAQTATVQNSTGSSLSVGETRPMSYIIMSKASDGIYYPDDAQSVTYEYLPNDVKAKLTQKDVKVILETSYDWQDRMTAEGGQNSGGEFVTKYPSLESYVYEKQATNNKPYTKAQVDAVLTSELVYLRYIGVLK